jgi:hypothetical protein
MPRTELDSIVPFVRNLLSDSAATTWSSTQPIVDALDAHSVFIDWTPMRHDLDYHRFESKSRTEGTIRDVLAGVRDLPAPTFMGADFGRFYRVGYFDTQWQISTTPDETGQLQSPSMVDAVGGTFVFSTAVQRELYLRGRVFNPWHAAADLLMETPDTGREIDTSRTRGQVSRTVKIKPEMYAQRGARLNRLRPEWSRA